MKKLFSIFMIFLAIASANLFAQKIDQPKSQFFIENKGQWDSKVQYLARLNGLNLWITKSGVVYDFFQLKVDNDITLRTGEPNPNFGINKIWGHVISSTFLNTNEHFTTQVFNKNQAYYNYFIGNDPAKWASFVPLYGSVQLNNIYNGIDVRYYYDNNLVRYDWIVRPGGDPSKIRIKFEGQNGMQVKSNGDLILQTSLGEVEHAKILAYQLQNGIQNIVECKFKDEGNGIVSFELGSYNPNQDLIIDPLVYSTFLGGSSDEWPYGVASDDMSNAYIVGYTKSSNFPTTTGAYDQTYNSVEDTFITKINSSGTQLIFSTFIGGSNSDFGFGIALDENGNIYIDGWTRGTYPTTPGCWDSQLNSNDMFVTKFNSTGSSLLYSTYLGGTSGDYALSIGVNSSGCAYVIGYTQSSNYPITTGCFDATWNGGSYDIVVTKFNATGSGLVYSTYLGGSSDELGYGLAVDGEGCAIALGYTKSTNFPTTSGCFDPSHNGSNDVTVTKLNATGSGLVYSTYLGGSLDEYGYGATVDASGNAYVTGPTMSSNFPTTEGAYDRTFNSSSSSYSDVYITKFGPYGAIIFSTFLGGIDADNAHCIAINDIVGKFIVGGFTYSNNFPITSDALDNVYSNREAFFSIMPLDGSILEYSTYLGGSNDDHIEAFSIGASPDVFILSCFTNSSNFLTTNGAWDKTLNGGVDAGVLSFEIRPQGTILIESIDNTQFCPGENISIKFSVTGKYQLDNVFIAQISDVNGAFTKPINIGQLEGIKGGTIKCTIPSDIPAGNSYRIRIVSTKPMIISEDNGYNLIILPFPTSYKIIGDDGYCEGDTKGAEIKLEDSEEGTLYQIYINGKKSGAPIMGTGKELSLGYHNQEGKYTIEATSAFGCKHFLSSEAYITMIPAPQTFDMIGGSKVYNEPGDGTYCEGEMGVAIGLNGSQEGVKYYLHLNGKRIGAPILPTGQDISFGYFTEEGTYTVLAISEKGGCTNNMKGSIKVRKIPAPTKFSLISTGTYCEESDGVEIILNGSETGIIYQLQFNGENIGAPVDGTGKPINFGSYKDDGVYTVIAQSTGGGCYSQMDGEIKPQMIPKPEAYDIAGLDYFCEGTEGSEITLTNSEEGVLYQLLRDGGAVGESIAGTGESISFGKQNIAGIYTIEAITIEGNCTNSMNGSINLREIPAPEIEITGNLAPNFGSSEIYEDAKASEGDKLEWSVIGGKISGSNTSISIEIDWGNNKSGKIRLTKTSAYGCISTVEIDINLINNIAIEFEADKTEGKAPLEVKFTDKSNGYITYRNWDFGDGKMSPQQNPTHIYTLPGKYTVSLTVGYEDVFMTGTKSEYIEVKSGVGINEVDITEGNDIFLSAIEPNPTNNLIRFSYSVSNPQNINIAIYNILGERVLSISDGYQTEGMHNKEINVSQLPSGAYYLQILGNVEQVNQMINIVK